MFIRIYGAALKFLNDQKIKIKFQGKQAFLLTLPYRGAHVFT